MAPKKKATHGGDMTTAAAAALLLLAEEVARSKFGKKTQGKKVSGGGHEVEGGWEAQYGGLTGGAKRGRSRKMRGGAEAAEIIGMIDAAIKSLEEAKGALLEKKPPAADDDLEDDTSDPAAASINAVNKPSDPAADGTGGGARRRKPSARRMRGGMSDAMPASASSMLKEVDGTAEQYAGYPMPGDGQGGGGCGDGHYDGGMTGGKRKPSRKPKRKMSGGSVASLMGGIGMN